jgi:glucosamine--fructose-6-phosphate aminotransferase (isomerizing)
MWFMCGIVGMIGKVQAAPHLFDGLTRLQYRGYDSAGIATLVDGRIERRRAQGKLSNLAAMLEQQPLQGTIGIGHTRWATHGRPSEINAHPHATEKVAIVHNGIIENFQELRNELEALGMRMTSETDTEVVAHLLTHLLECGYSPQEAMDAAMGRLKGAFSLAALFAGRPDIMIGARRGSPLAVGYGDGEMFLGSDAMAIAPFTDRICYLQEDDWAVLTADGASIYNEGSPVRRAVTRTAVSVAAVGKGKHAHFMMKEIAEQPIVVSETLRNFFDPLKRQMELPPLPLDPAKLTHLTIVACGTAHLAGHVAKYWLEEVAQLSVEIDIASEFRYRRAPMDGRGALLVISQSGETADTIGAVRRAKELGQKIISVLNVTDSTLGRESDVILPTRAGTEIGVAATKTFTTQLATLAALTLAFARARGAIDQRQEAELTSALMETPTVLARALECDPIVRTIALEVAKARDVLFLGRGTSYPVALEGALKLKEISYIHAEGYAAGEMKHGPIALIDREVPVIGVAPSDDLFDKIFSNLQEVLARGGRVILLSDEEGAKKLGSQATASVTMPPAHPFIAPIVYAVPVQLLAYHAAVARGTDVDHPRNLAKSVTVE